MSDQFFETEGVPSSVSDELLPDPGFDSEISLEPPSGVGSERDSAPSASLFPSDPFLSPFSAPSSDEAVIGEEPLPDPTFFSVENEEQPVHDLFDPAPILTETGAEPSLFDMPEQDPPLLELAAEPSAQQEQSPTVQETKEEAKRRPAPRPKKKREKRRDGARHTPVREMTAERIRELRLAAASVVRFGRMRFAVAVILAVLLAVVELFPTFGVDVTVPLGISRVRASLALLDIQLLLLIGLCAWRSVIVGFRYLFTRRFRAECLLSLGLASLLGYDAYLYVSGAAAPALVALPLAVALVFTVWIEQNEYGARCGILHLLSAEGGVSVASATKVGTRRRLSVSRAERVDGYAEHIDDFSERAGLRVGLLLAALLAFALAFFFTYKERGLGVLCLAAGFSAFFTVAPFAALLARRLYLARLQEVLLERSTALIGEEEAFSAACAEIFSIADTEAFSSDEIKIKIVNVFHDYRLDEALRLITAIYRLIGGPFYPVLERTGGGAGEIASLSLADVGSDGVLASCEGEEIALGSADFMKRNGIAFTPETEADLLLAGDRMCLLYCAVNGKIVARFYVEYALSASFESLAEQLAKMGVSVEIRTSDPSISEPYLARISCLPRGALTVRRVSCGELLEPRRARVASRFFTLDRPRALLGAWLAFRRYTRVRRFCDAIAVGQALLGSALFALLALGFGTPLVPLSLSALYHALSLVLLVRASLGFRNRISSEIADECDGASDEESDYRLPKGISL